MKTKLVLLSFILAAAPFSFGDSHLCQNGYPQNVPDSGSTILLVGMAIAGLLVAAKKRFHK